MLKNNTKTLIAIPMFNCGSFTLEQLNIISEKELPPNSEVLVIDNQSSDNSIELITQMIHKLPLKIKIIKNSKNYSLGGSSKIAFKYGLENNFDYLLIHHGSGKSDFNNFVNAKELWGKHDMLLGSRFMKGANNENYSWIQYYGNIFFNSIFSIILRKKILDLGSSTNFYRLDSKHLDFIMKCSDGLTFNYYLLIHQINFGLTFTFFPSPLKVSGQKSSLNLLSHLSEMLSILNHLLIGKKILNKNYAKFEKYEFYEISKNY